MNLYLETVVVAYLPLCPELFTVSIETKVIWFSNIDCRSIPDFSANTKKEE
jgi:hypothetical protein